MRWPWQVSDGTQWRHYCRMLLTRHYDQRPFDESVCDALIANGDVKTHQKRCKTFAMADTSNTVRILDACAMRGIRLIHTNYLRWDRTTKTGSQIKVCAIYVIQFTPMNVLWWGGTTEMGSQMKVCAIYGIQFTRINYLWWGGTTEMGSHMKVCAMYSI